MPFYRNLYSGDNCAVIRQTLAIIFVIFLVHIEHAGETVYLFGLMVTIRPRRGDKISPAQQSQTHVVCVTSNPVKSFAYVAFRSK